MLLAAISPQASIFFCIVATVVVYFAARYFFGGSTVKQPFEDESDWGRH